MCLARPVQSISPRTPWNRVVLPLVSARFPPNSLSQSNLRLRGKKERPSTVVQAPVNSEAEFTQDVVVRFKASERGQAAVIEPRKFQRHRALSTSSSSGA